MPKVIVESEVFKWMVESRSLIGQSVVLSNYWLRLKLIVPSNQFLYGNPVQFLIFGDISAHDPVNTVILGVFIIFHAYNFLKFLKKIFMQINLDEAKALLENLQYTVSVFTLVSLKRVEKEISEGCCASGI